MNKVIFLDRDNTIIEDYGYIHKIEDLKFMDKAIEGLKAMNDMGYKLIIITNQSGIGRKMYSVEEYHIFHNYLTEKLLNNNIKITKTYFCPHTDDDNCNCRKPKLGLFKKAIQEFDIDLNSSYAIGDKERDLSICQFTNIKGIIIGNNNKNYICKSNLLDAANYIKQCDENKF